MKNLFWIAVVALMSFTVAGCNKAAGNEGKLESSWDKAAKEYTFLKNFPKYDYDFQGFYQKVPMAGGETYILTDRKGSEAKWKEYKTKLSGAGYAEEVMTEYASKFTKTDAKGEYTAAPSLSGGNVIVSYAFVKAE